MKTHTIILNIVLVTVIAGMTYGATMLFNAQKPENTKIVVIDGKNKSIPPKTGDVIENFEFQIEGKTYNLHDFKGKTIILNFWASWCPPCIKEFPYFLKAADTYGDDIAFIALSSDLDIEKMNAFLKRLNPPEKQNVLIAFDENQTITRGAFNIFKLPETFLIAPDMTLKKHIKGAEWTYEDLEADLSAIVNAASTTP